MSTTKWCLVCKKELGGEDSALSMFGVGSATGRFCKNSKCNRYGLVTVIYLEEEKKAPEDLKTNDVVDEEK